ncbi:hypothetical protein Tco_1427159 [Tanacetum coccineum]
MSDKSSLRLDGMDSNSNAFQDYLSQPSSFPFSHHDYVSQTQMVGSSSQRCTDPTMSPINAFPVDELYSPQFPDSFQENIGYWQEPNPYKSLVEQVATSPPKMKMPTRARQKRMIQTMMHPGILRGHMRTKLRWLKVGLMFPKTASMVTRGRKLDFGVWFWRTWRAKQNSTVVKRTIWCAGNRRRCAR